MSDAQTRGSLPAFPVIASSTFDQDDEQWVATEDASGMEHVPKGGNPGGYIKARDTEQGRWWYWQAPETFLGNVSGAAELRYDMKQSAEGEYDEISAMVHLGGAGLNLQFRTEMPPGVDWTTFRVPLHDAAGWKKIINGQAVEKGLIATDDATQEDLRAVLSSLKSLLIRGEYQSGADDSGLDNVHLVRISAATAADRDPARIGVETDPPSTMVNGFLQVFIYLLDEDGALVRAQQTTQITLEASAGELLSETIEFLKGDVLKRTALRTTEPGLLSVRARSDAGLEPGEASGAACGDGNVEDLDFLADRVRAPIGQPIDVTITLTTTKGVPVSDGNPKSLQFNQDGVGEWQQLSRAMIPRGECAARLRLVSNQPGSTEVTANVGTISSDSRTFTFFLQLMHAGLVAMAAGIVGAFVRTTRRWSKSVRWSPGQWVIKLAVGGAAGALVYLAARAGIVESVTDLLLSWEAAIVLGLIGGYLGLLAFDRLADRVLPAAKPS